MKKNKNKPDFSPIVPQREKIKDELKIKEHPHLTDVQKQILEAAADKKVKCLILNGVSGTSKTYCAVLAGLKLLSSKTVGELVYVRSLVQAKDGETGFLSGSLEEKTHYFNIPLYDKLGEILYKSDMDFLLKENRIKTLPTSMLRGLQITNSVCILDENQNCHIDSIITLMTRMGPFSKLFLLGDTRGQNDYGSKSGFKEICSMFNDQESYDNGFRYFQLDSKDIVRSSFVKFVVEKVEKHNMLKN